MEINYQTDASDLDAARLHVRKRARGQKAGVSSLIWLALGIATVIEYFLNEPEVLGDNPYLPWAWLVAGLAFAGSAVWASVWSGSGRYRRWLDQFAGSHTLTLTPVGIALRAPGGRNGFYAWPEIIALEPTDSCLYFYLRRNAAFAVPCAMLEGTVHAFVAEARRLWAEHPGNSGKFLPDTPGIPEALASQCWANACAAARVVSFRDYDIQAFRASRGALSLLLLAQLIWLAATDYVGALPAPEFSSAGLGAFGLSVLLTFAWAAGITSFLVQRAALLRLLVMIAASTLVIDMVYLPVYVGVERLLPNPDKALWGLFAAAMLWMLAAMFRIMRRLHGQPAPYALGLASSYVLFTLALALVAPGQRLFYGADPAEEAVAGSTSRLDMEDVYYRQPELVGRALQDVRPHAPGDTGLYFVGFAGDASEREFGNEVRYAQDLLNDRFNTVGRSLALINDVDTVNQMPLANTHNLEAVLRGLAQRMDKKKDVLFLFLSSHGAQDHRLAVSFNPLGMHDVSAEKLKEMLDKSGIRNRVIVVSACYSGGFLDVLKDDNSLVLTASRRDHVAYGCGDVTEYTYFGEAYFVKALRHSNSFIAAFDEARRLIAEREKREGVDASSPQIHVGRNIGKVLQRLKVQPDDGCPEYCTGESG